MNIRYEVFFVSLFKRKNIHLVTQVVLHTQGHMGRERVKSSAINWLGSISWSLNPTRWLPHTNLMQDRSPGSTLMSHISHCRGKAGLHQHHAHAACMHILHWATPAALCIPAISLDYRVRAGTIHRWSIGLDEEAAIMTHPLYACRVRVPYHTLHHRMVKPPNI